MTLYRQGLYSLSLTLWNPDVRWSGHLLRANIFDVCMMQRQTGCKSSRSLLGLKSLGSCGAFSNEPPPRSHVGFSRLPPTLLSSACSPSPTRPTRPNRPTRLIIGGSGASPGRCNQCRRACSVVPPIRPAPRRQRRGLPVLFVLLRDSSNRANSVMAAACGF